MKLVNIINIILTSLICPPFPSYFVVVYLFLLILNEVPIFFNDRNPALMNFSPAAVRDHRRHHLQPTVHIAQVGITVILFHFMRVFFCLNRSFSPIMSCAGKPTHHCQSTVCNEQCWREGKQSQASLLVIGSYFLTILSPVAYIQFNWR